jgi:hypothetical protein
MSHTVQETLLNSWFSTCWQRCPCTSRTKLENTRICASHNYKAHVFRQKLKLEQAQTSIHSHGTWTSLHISLRFHKTLSSLQTLSEHWVNIEWTLSEHWRTLSERWVNVEWTLSEDWVNIEWTLSEHWVNIEWTLSEHWVNIEWTLSEHW